MERCRGVIGLLFGHNYEEIFDEEHEYFEPTENTQRLGLVSQRGTTGPLKKESVVHQYCVCRRCGQQVSKDRKSLFTKEDK